MSKQQRDKKVLRSILPMTLACLVAAQVSSAGLQVHARLALLWRLGKLNVKSGTVDSATLSERFSALLGSKEAKALLKQKEDLDAVKAQTAQLSKAKQESLMYLAARIKAYKQNKNESFMSTEDFIKIANALESANSDAATAFKSGTQITVYSVPEQAFVVDTNNNNNVVATNDPAALANDLTGITGTIVPRGTVLEYGARKVALTEQQADSIKQVLSLLNGEGSQPEDQAQGLRVTRNGQDEVIGVGSGYLPTDQVITGFRGAISKSKLEGKPANLTAADKTDFGQAVLLGEYEGLDGVPGINGTEANNVIAEFTKQTEGGIDTSLSGDIETAMDWWQRLAFDVGMYLPFEIFPDSVHLGPTVDIRFSMHSETIGDNKEIKLATPFAASLGVAALVNKMFKFGLGVELAYRSLSSSKFDNGSTEAREMQKLKSEIDAFKDAVNSLQISNNDFDSTMNSASDIVESTNKARSASLLAFGLKASAGIIWWLSPELGVTFGGDLMMPFGNDKYDGDFVGTEIASGIMGGLNAGIVYALS